MDQLSDSEISLSDDEVYQLLEAVEEPGDQFLATYMGGDPFQLGLAQPSQQPRICRLFFFVFTLLVVLTN